MSTILLVEIKQNDIELSKLSTLGIRSLQAESWRHKSKNITSFINLIKYVGVIDEIPERQERIYILPVNVCEYVNDDIHDITEYFHKLVIKAFENFGLETNQNEELPDIIIFNFMPFLFRPANGNRIIQGILKGLTNFRQLSRICIIFFVQQHTLFSGSEQLSYGIQSNEGPNKVVIIDLNGYAVTIERSYEETQTEPIKSKKDIPRTLFKEILHFEDEKSFRNALVYETNLNIGHFDVRSCHVRTHYDLVDFIRRDNVFEHLYNEFYNITDNFNGISIISTGLEDEALTIFGNRIESANKNDIRAKISDKKQLREVFWRGHFSSNDLFNQKKSVEKWIRDSDCLFLLTDVVNTGSTIFKLKYELENFLKDIKKTKIKIQLYSIIKMNNSPKEIPSSVFINRPFYPSNSFQCPLCMLNQPINRINPSTWKMDFRCVSPYQLTPLDFWELVQDCQSLKRDMPYLAGGKLIHRVDTPKLIQRYKNWLSNIIKFKYSSAWGEKLPEKIITLKGEPSEGYARFIVNALSKPKKDIICIPREVINEEGSLPDYLELQLKNLQKKKKDILLVDDGINRGSTAKKLIKYINKYKLSIMGFFILDSRLNEKQSQEIESSMNDGKLVCLYNWPSYPV